jgi:hypothetical protein
MATGMDKWPSTNGLQQVIQQGESMNMGNAMNNAGLVRLLAVAVLGLVLAACSTTSTVHRQHDRPAGQLYGYAFENNGGDDMEGIAELERLIKGRLGQAGLLAADPAATARIEVVLTHYYVRSNAARFWAGIMAGRDKIISRVTVRGADGQEAGSFNVESTNATAWGSKGGLMEKHADEIVARLQ